MGITDYLKVMKFKDCLCDWHFEIISFEDFSLKLKMKSDTSLMGVMVRMAKKTIEQKTHTRLSAEEVARKTEDLDLGKGYNNLIHTGCTSVLKNIYSDITKDGIDIIREKVEKVSFRKEGKEWFILVDLKGQYVRNK